ncbi:MAG: hypothetical protein WC979_02925 [Candidatus Pacearchaeota archaeon]|jgi:hypothetical protein|nr:hypothetical protein [Clostridia bacterium]
MKNDSESKTRSAYQKDINRLRKTCVKLNLSNELRKYQIHCFDSFIKQLLSEKRITKKEISDYMIKRKDIEL